jgi:hypothetical protein
MTRIIALMALTTLGLSGAPVHEPVHAEAPLARVILLLCVTTVTSRGGGVNAESRRLAPYTRSVACVPEIGSRGPQRPALLVAGGSGNEAGWPAVRWLTVSVAAVPPGARQMRSRTCGWHDRELRMPCIVLDIPILA